MSAGAARARKPIAPSSNRGSSGYTQVPNSYFDRLPRCTTPAEYVVVGVILRQTRGWGRDEAEIPVPKFVELTGLAERSVYLALKGLRRKELIPRPAEESAGKTTKFKLNFERFDTVDELPRGMHVVKRNETDGRKVEPVETERALCLNCQTIGPVVSLEFEELPAFAEALIEKVSPTQQVDDSTIHMVCRGRHEAAPVEDCRGEGRRLDASEPGTPAVSCRGQAELEPLEKYLIGWIPHFSAPFPAGFVQQIDTRLGGAPLKMFAARCELRRRKLTGWGLMLNLADDVRNGAKLFNGGGAKAVRRVVNGRSIEDVLDAIGTLEDARWLMQSAIDEEMRAALVKKFPGLAT